MDCSSWWQIAVLWIAPVYLLVVEGNIVLSSFTFLAPMEDECPLWGYPRWKDGELVNGLEIHNVAPPIKTLLGKYTWAKFGVDGSSNGPQLDKGFELWLEDPEGPAEFPNIQGKISMFSNEGIFTGIRLRHSQRGDGPEYWEFKINWPADRAYVYPAQVYIYVGRDLDDNGYPFIEALLGDRYPSPWAYAKRQLEGGECVGLSEVEGKRIVYLEMYKRRREAETRQRDWERELRRIRRMEKQSPPKSVSQAKNNGSRSQDVNPELPKMSKGARNRANKARRAEAAKLAEEEARMDLLKKPPPVSDSACINGTSLQDKMEEDVNPELPKMSKGARKRTNKARRAEAAKLAEEEARMDLLKNPAPISDANSINETSVQMEEVKTEPCETPLAPIKQEDVKTELCKTPLVPAKQEKPTPSIPFSNRRGTKREHEGGTNDTSVKRIKLDQ